MKIILKTLTLICVFFWVKYFKERNNINVKIDIIFSIYRSICCLFLFIYAFQSFLKDGKKGLIKPFEYTNFDTKDLMEWFAIYLMIDLLIMTGIKCKRIDLWFHHFISIIVVFIIYKHSNNNIPFLINIILLAEAMSIMSGIDSQYTENNDMIKSMFCKKIRKNIINFWRTPIWLLISFLSIKNINKKDNKIFKIIGIIGPITMFSLDRYWLDKCEKVIKKY
jgi:hypothetical protein